MDAKKAQGRFLLIFYFFTVFGFFGYFFRFFFCFSWVLYYFMYYDIFKRFWSQTIQEMTGPRIPPPFLVREFSVLTKLKSYSR